MSLMQSLTPLVSPGVRQRGESYYRQGAVLLLDGDGTEVAATVLGSRPYAVTVKLDEEGIETSCDCPYFLDRDDLCKHVWATVLAAQEEGLLRALTPKPAPHRSGARQARSPAASWTAQLGRIAASQRDEPDQKFIEGELLYVIRVPETISSGSLTLDIGRRDRKRDGSWGKFKPQRINSELVSRVRDVGDRQVASMLLGTRGWESAYSYYYSGGRGFPGTAVIVPHSIIEALVPLICGTGRCYLRTGVDEGDLVPVTWDDGPAWELCLEARVEKNKGFVIDARLERGGQRMDLSMPAMLLAGGFIFGKDGLVARLEEFGSFGWVAAIRNQGPVVVPAGQSESFLKQLLGMRELPRLDFPPELEFEEVHIKPNPRLTIRRAMAPWGRSANLTGSLSFDYEGQVADFEEDARGFFRSSDRAFVLRDRSFESEAAVMLQGLGFHSTPQGFELAPRHLPGVVRALIEAEWHVEAEGRVYRRAGKWSAGVRSGIDWFDVTGSFQFGDETASLPELLEALRRGENFVTLGDGSAGLLPEEWLQRYGLLASLGSVKGEAVRFKPGQVGLLDALVASQPEVTFDEAFARAREKLRAFEGIEAEAAPGGFSGELRGYQREGLGWLGFLQRFGFGGCLADDMGLGKTVQVLALLESRRELRASTNGRKKLPPSLVVVPKSLVFNWIREAERFTPKLSVLDHTGARLPPGEHFDDYDVILTTFGTLRRDAVPLAEVNFDYCILDEAQAIKNASTASAKAVRLVKAAHRLALSGTPIQNHLGELWSLFEFLNPGVLGSGSAFKLWAGNGRSPDPAASELLARALRPFILRRTKEQVAADLPPKSEQTLFCELQGGQRKQYQQLLAHYRRNLLSKVDREGIGRSKMLVIEALLRLRQAACHPGLIDRSKAGEASAKLDLLVPQLAEVVEEGHKALVFSQFTSFLAIVRDRLDREGVAYEYLDGRTRNREERVDRFQSDPDCRVFLISLKAGGLGLNLTAAEYVFLLDPWWNPAVEAQAIDRTHRIGQDKPVFAYRIIASDTVEEKVLELQASKRDLADAIINADNSLIRSIQREDLELLLS